ncbi:MAG: hypothetical protein J7K09_01850 [Desulfuromusa sp.]|nr:hypothetical protein [Desulfuromusa sp.]
MRKIFITLKLWLILCLLFSVPTVMAQTGQPHIPSQSPLHQSPKPETTKMPAMNFVAPGILEIGDCRVDKKNGRVEFPARVNMQEGLLEYLLVGDAGKLHESLLSTEISPYALQVSLLLLGIEGSYNPLEMQGEARTPEGGRINIKVRWQDGKRVKTVALEKWLKKDKSKLNNIPWVFTGSVVIDGVFMAEVERSIIAIFHDPVAMIDHQLPEGADDQVWFVDSEQTPSRGTAVTVIIEAAK